MSSAILVRPLPRRRWRCDIDNDLERSHALRFVQQGPGPRR